MEPDFIAELDRTLTNVGTDVFWKKKIGKLELWLSPLSVSGQEKVTAALDKATPGLNIVGESKKVTLSNVVVGVNGLDFREYRGTNQPVFPMKGRDGKTTNVALEKYLYEKMSGWSTDYLDNVFEVYADCMETFQKQNLKDIKFENTKDPRLELVELERRVATLRAQLGLPQMVEKSDQVAPDDIEPAPEDIAAALEEEERLTREGTEDGRTKGKEEGKPEGKQEDFDPFKPLTPEQQAGASPSVQAAPVYASPPQPRQPPPPSPPPQPTMGMPVALPRNLQRPMPPGHQPQESSPEAPHVATPSVPNEVLERPADRPQFVPPKIDRVPPNANPRFSPPRR